MAKVKKNFLGEVRGKVGDVIYRKRGNMEYVSSVPKKRVSFSDAEIENQNKMKAAGKFSRVVKDIEVLFKIWDSAKIKGYEDSHPVNKITGINYKYVLPGRVTENNKITPGGFTLAVKGVRCLESKIEVKLKEVPRKRVKEKFIFLLLYWFGEPKLKKYSEYASGSIIKEMMKIDKEIVFELDEDMMRNSARYSERIIFLALLVVDEEGRIVSWSSTFAKKVE